MARLGLTMNKVKAIFISHEHIDHIRGVTVLAKKYRLPVYITQSTLTHGGLALEQQLVMSFTPYEPVQVGALSITAFPKHHDASEPHSFIVTGNAVTIGVFTDIGAPCEHVIRHFQQCHAAFLEANYDVEMLDKGRYPYYLKNRIRGGKGHLSNTQALEIFNTWRPPFMSLLLLAHLSRDNNNPALVQELFDQHANGVQIVVASRFGETAVYRIIPTNSEDTTATTPLSAAIAEVPPGKLF